MKHLNGSLTVVSLRSLCWFSDQYRGGTEIWSKSVQVKVLRNVCKQSYLWKKTTNYAKQNGNDRAGCTVPNRLITAQAVGSASCFLLNRHRGQHWAFTLGTKSQRLLEVISLIISCVLCFSLLRNVRIYLLSTFYFFILSFRQFIINFLQIRQKENQPNVFGLFDLFQEFSII